mmetsp:Transcript_9142/g.22414  ORF Transcript_9142/g.22414 Transcript_9142/m.22414 type:complete len:152 (-) Transcript_9142:405-860(-)|eukprot:CAMPEP_0178993350 /NCGR_PEP_ID=MMETSP0795-20121207/6654_1 /TAXON_ID=88552 /ORGANISM="Amoebophrya sp., Strain Ameob2" /LENGTH=151 /DNA_ID=CAMNT_0020685399 /DNA_START=354 /DNA_END=809 /DNA_ORIENTATION=-
MASFFSSSAAGAASSSRVAQLKGFEEDAGVHGEDDESVADALASDDPAVLQKRLREFVSRLGRKDRSISHLEKRIDYLQTSHRLTLTQTLGHVQRQAERDFEIMVSQREMAARARKAEASLRAECERLQEALDRSRKRDDEKQNTDGLAAT